MSTLEVFIGCGGPCRLSDTSPDIPQARGDSKVKGYGRSAAPAWKEDIGGTALFWVRMAAAIFGQSARSGARLEKPWLLEFRAEARD